MDVFNLVMACFGFGALVWAIRFMREFRRREAEYYERLRYSARADVYDGEWISATVADVPSRDAQVVSHRRVPPRCWANACEGRATTAIGLCDKDYARLTGGDDAEVR